MPPQYKSFRVSCREFDEAEEELNRFLRSVKVLGVCRDFVADGADSFMIYTVEYLDGAASKATGSPGRNRVDYKEVLSDDDFTLFARLREWRKEAAAREAVPVFAVLTNEQLARIAQQRPQSPAGLQEIDGIGEAKTTRYGEAVLAIVGGADAVVGADLSANASGSGVGGSIVRG